MRGELTQRLGAVPPMFGSAVELMQLVVHMLRRHQSAADDIPGLELLHPAQPQGRPMRSLANVNSFRSLAVPTHSLAPLPALSPETTQPPAAATDGQTLGRASGIAAPSDPRDVVAKVAEVMLKRGAAPNEHDTTMDTDDETDGNIDESWQGRSTKKTGSQKIRKAAPARKVATRAPKATVVAMHTPTTSRKKTKIAKTTAKKLVKAKADSKKDAWPRKPSIGWETSRNQVMCRTGKGGKGSSFRIQFSEAGSAKKAWRRAQAWLEKTMKEYSAFIA